MTDHDAMVLALVDEKSLDALLWLVEHGREVEFTADGVSCFISHRQSYVALWIGQEERRFPSTAVLIEDSTFLTAWERAQVETVF